MHDFPAKETFSAAAVGPVLGGASGRAPEPDSGATLGAALCVVAALCNQPTWSVRAAVSSAGVRVQAPARLHMGFIDVSGTAGRRFGSVGLTLEGLATEVVVRPGEGVTTVAGPARAQQLVTAVEKILGARRPMAVSVRQLAPEHAGFGTGTQMALAIGAALGAFCDHDASVRWLAESLGRGARSGIGIGAFEQGGFLVDGGHGVRAAVPPVTVRLNFPTQWRILLITDGSRQGLSGQAEVDAFENLPAFPAGQAHRLAHSILVKGLPALVEQDLTSFGEVITDLQSDVGDYFAKVQGSRFLSAPVAEVLTWLLTHGATGVGQSSWGPTGFAFVESEQRAQQLQHDFVIRFTDRYPALQLHVHQARNQGALIERVAQ